MLIVTTDYIPGQKFKVLGIVKGSSIQSKHIGSDIGQSFKSIVGGELKSYNEMMDKARDISAARMHTEAAALNADAIVNVRYTTSSIIQGAAEIMVYGTAVKFIEE